MRLCPYQRHTVSKDQKFVDALLSLWAIPLLAGTLVAGLSSAITIVAWYETLRDLQQQQSAG